MKDLFTLAKMNNDDAIWVKMKKEVSGECRDIFIGVFYLNPSRNQRMDQKISKLSDNVIDLQTKGEVILMGDLNARTGNLEDTVCPDKYDELFELEINHPPLKRNSRDAGIDSRGKELLDVCKSLDLYIANGRKTGDLFGDYTCIKHNGNSVVDYLITSSFEFKKVTSLKVGEFFPWLSDHCPLYFTLEVQMNTRTPVHVQEKKKAPKHYIWDEGSKERFANVIKTPDYDAKWEKSAEIDHSDPNLLVNYVSEVLLCAADTAKVKYCKRSDTNDPPWFDKSCRDLKDSVSRLGKKIRQSPKDQNLKSELTSQKKRLKKLIKANKINYKNHLMEQMKQSKNDSKRFWRFLDKFEKRPNDTIFKQGISNQRWVNHFKNVFQDPSVNSPLPENTRENGELDREISDEELKLAGYVLRNGKSPGFDSISNEMLQCLLQARPDILKKIFNCILNNPRVIEKWSISMITPLHKSGSKMDPDNYRGISLLSCFSKYFCAILNLRLTNFIIDKGILSRAQLGFRSGCRTADALLILYNLIEQYCHKKGEFIYGCFVDFKKAFDSIPRHTLFKKLLFYDINGKFYDCLVNIYSNDIACIKISDSITPSFIANQGVKQGCILSPTLFNIFLSDLQPITETEACDPIELTVGNKLGCLIWADDLLLMSKSKGGLDNMLSNLKSYTEKNGMTLNVKKNKVMIFNKTGRHMRRNFYFGKDKVETTRQYKYLGFLVTPSGVIHSGLRDLKDRALKAFHKLKNKMGITFKKHPSTTIKLFRSLIEPILLYASDFWGCLKMPDNNPVEVLHLSFCKQLLGVQKQTTNDGVLLELGQMPITLLARKRATKNWVRLTTNTECNEIVIDSFQNAITMDLTWPKNIESLISEIGLRQVFLDKDKNAHLKVFQRLQDIYHQVALAGIKRGDSKLRTYGLIKSTPGFEKYLDEIGCIKERVALTKLRLSNHSLMIEKGRHSDIDKKFRFCPFCPNIVEDEKHFLLKCKAYNHIRADLLDRAKQVFPSICNQPHDVRFFNLMSDPTITPISNFVHRAMELRDFLLSEFRVMG